MSVRICLQRQKESEELPCDATDTLTKASLDDSAKQGMCHFWICFEELSGKATKYIKI